MDDEGLEVAGEADGIGDWPRPRGLRRQMLADRGGHGPARPEGRGRRALIKQRGRWQSNVALVYQRAIVDAQLEASAGIGDASGVELEA
eukprot:1576382-Pleurochrysis_carterae.AAC.1